MGRGCAVVFCSGMGECETCGSELVAFFEVLFKQIASKVVFKISPNQMGVIGVVLSVHVFD